MATVQQELPTDAVFWEDAPAGPEEPGPDKPFEPGGSLLAFRPVRRRVLRAQALALSDMTSQARRQGNVVSRPQSEPADSVQARARLAQSRLLEHQLNPLGCSRPIIPGSSSSLRDRARAAQRAALDSQVLRPRPGPVPQRSI